MKWRRGVNIVNYPRTPSEPRQRRTFSVEYFMNDVNFATAPSLQVQSGVWCVQLECRTNGDVLTDERNASKEEFGAKDTGMKNW